MEFLLGVPYLLLGVLLYSNRIIHRMSEQSEATTRLFSRFIAEVVFEVQDSGKRELLQEVIQEIRLPIILTDVNGRPFAWHRVGFDPPADEDFDVLQTIDPANPPPGKFQRIIELTVLSQYGVKQHSCDLIF